MAKTTVGELVYKIRGDTQGVVASIENTERKLTGLGATFRKVNKSKIAMFTAGTAAITALGGTLVSATKKAYDLQKRMGDISTLMIDNQQATGALQDEILNLTRTVPKSADELGAAAYDILSAGITDTEEAMDALEYSAKLATAGLGTTKEAANLMTGALNAFENQNISAERAANVFFETVRQGKTTVAELAQSFGSVAPIASTLNVELEELQAATAALTTANIKTSEAQTYLRASLNSLIKPSRQMKDLLGEIGDEMTGRKLVEERGLVGALRAVKEAADNDEELAKAMGRIRGLNAVLSLTGEQAETFNNIMEDMEEATSLEKAFGQQMETPANKLQLTINKLNERMIRLGNKALPIVDEALDRTNGFLDDLLEDMDILEDYTTNVEKSGNRLNLLTEEMKKAQKGESEFSKETLLAASKVERMTQKQEEYRKVLDLLSQAQSGNYLQFLRARNSLMELGIDIGREEGNIWRSMSIIQEEYSNKLSKSLEKERELLPAYRKVMDVLEGRYEEMEKNNDATANNINSTDELTEAQKEAKEELSDFQDQMLGFIESAEQTSEELQGDLKDSFDEFGKSLKDTFKETDDELADIVVDAEEKVEELQSKLEEERSAEERDSERIQQLRDEIQEEKEILESSEGYEQRRAEQIKKIRSQLEEAGIKPEAIGLEDLKKAKTLEERITQERKRRQMNEFERFEQQQFKKIQLLTEQFVTETRMAIEKVATQKKYEQELTDFLVETNDVREKSVNEWAKNAKKKYGEVANELENVISKQRRLSDLGATPAEEQYQKGGFVGPRGGRVHAGEYVIPNFLMDKFGGVIGQIEQARTGQQVVNTTNNNINQNVQVNEQIDYDAFAEELTWKMGQQ